MALAKRNNKTGWSVEQIKSMLGNAYTSEQIEKALAEFGSVGSEEELATFQKMLPTVPTKAEPVQQATQPKPAQPTNQSVAATGDKFADLFQVMALDRFQQRMENFFDGEFQEQAAQRLTPILERFTASLSLPEQKPSHMIQAQSDDNTPIFDVEAKPV